MGTLKNFLQLDHKLNRSNAKPRPLPPLPVAATAVEADGRTPLDESPVPGKQIKTSVAAQRGRAPAPPIPQQQQVGTKSRVPNRVRRIREGTRRRWTVLRTRLSVLKPRGGRKPRPSKPVSVPAVDQPRLACMARRRRRLAATLQPIPEPEAVQVEGFPLLHAHEDLETFNLMQEKLRLVEITIERCLGLLAQPVPARA